MLEEGKELQSIPKTSNIIIIPLDGFQRLYFLVLPLHDGRLFIGGVKGEVYIGIN